MGNNRPGGSRRDARTFALKRAGAVEEALRSCGVTAHVTPVWHARRLLVQVADPDADGEGLAVHAAALAAALLADAVTISTGLRDFIVRPTWCGLDDNGADALWPLAGDVEPAPDWLVAAATLWTRLSTADIQAAFLQGYRTGRLAGVLGDLQRYLVFGGPQRDRDPDAVGRYEMRLAAGCDGDAVRAHLRSQTAAIAEALGATTCRIGGVGRRITITPAP